MSAFSLKQLLIGLAILAVLGVGAAFISTRNKTVQQVPPLVVKPPAAPSPKIEQPERSVIGTSVQGRAIETYTYGNGTTHLLFVGGMHGGYEWNSVVLAYQFIDELRKNPTIIPANLMVTVIPSLNPDGVYEVVGKEGRFTVADVPVKPRVLGTGRLNAHQVDLNRNFDCNWKPTSMWQGKTVAAGTKAFSEPEATALRDFVLKERPDAVVFWHSQSGSVYASQCEKGILPETLTIMNAYAHAAGYTPIKSFDAYPITGDSEGWLASIHIPALTVELKTHETVEWERNLAGINALFKFYKEKTKML